MIKINLIKNQIPTELDIPKRKKGYKHTLIFFSILIAVFLVSFVGVYFLFIKTAEHKIEHAVNKKVLEHKKESKQTKQHIAIKKPEEKIVQHKKYNNKTKISENELKKIENEDSAVFSFKIQLENIPSSNSTIQKNVVLEDVLKDMEKDNLTSIKLSDNKSIKTTKTTKATQKKEKEVYKNKSKKLLVKVVTSNPKRLKIILRKMGVKYKMQKIKRRSRLSYDILVGGFDSYRKLVRFASVLKKKGYKIYDIKNLGLKFFVCIDKNVDKKKRDRYIAVWKKTPFRIVAKEKEKIYYRYVFKFKVDKNRVKLLKKKGYYPIIISPKNGA